MSSFSSADLAAVNAAIASGELSVRTADGKMVQLRSVDELLQAKRVIEADMAAAVQTGTGVRRGAFAVRFSTARGF